MLFDDLPSGGAGETGSDGDLHAGDALLLRLDPARPFRWLFLDFNSYFASVEQQEEPALRGRPVGVVPSAGENTCVIAASVEARALGVRTGTPLREARRLCPGIALRPARHALYVAYHRRVLAEVERHAPVSRVWSIDEVSVRLLGPQRAPEGALAVARAIKSGLAARVGPCLRCSIGLAPSWRLAKLATELEKPDGLVALGPQSLPGRLLHLSLRDFPGIGPRLAARLGRCGVSDAAGLWALGPKRARLVWGSVEGERFWYGLRGADLPEPPATAPGGAPHSLSHARVLPPELRDPASARHVSRLLAMKATARLRAAACLATALALGVEPASSRGRPRTRDDRGGLYGETRLRQTDDDRVVLAALDGLWAALLAGPDAPRRVWRVSVALAGLIAAARVTPDLLDLLDPGAAAKEARARPPPEPHSRLSRAVDAVHRRFGRGSLVFGPVPLDWEAYAGTKIAFSRLPVGGDAPAPDDP